MGVVYKARQVSLDRLVALKMLLFGRLESKDSIQRFRIEASAAASLQHPNIVAVHEVGVHDGQHYLVMEYITGQTLSKISGGQPLPPPRAAAYVKTIAEAIHYAHEKGVLHRDLKPSNVLIDLNDEPHVTDFGLAKRLDSETDLTLSGQVLGSPSYMSPEQASGARGKVGRYSDIYSLGAILFHLLTGRPPFVAETINETIELVLERDPVTPRVLVAGVPRDLETICLKCLEKEPTKRYATAQELAEELDRFLKNEPIRARRSSRVEKAWRWCRRKPVVASLSAATAALVLAVAIGSPIAAFRIAREKELAQTKAAEAQRNLYISNMRLAQQAWERYDLRRLQRLLYETGTYPDHGFEWYYWQRLAHLELKVLPGHTQDIVSLTFSPVGQRIVTGSTDKTAKLWDVATRRALFTFPGNSAIECVAFAPDGSRILTCDTQTIRMWDSVSGLGLFTNRIHRGHILSAAFSAGGLRILAGTSQGEVMSWDAAASTPFDIAERRLFTSTKAADTVLSLAFSADGQWVVTGHADHTAKVWDTASGKLLRTLAGHGGGVVAVAFSPDAKRIVAASAQEALARVWDVATSNLLMTVEGVESVAFSRDGQRIITGCGDSCSRVWEVATERQSLTLRSGGDQWAVAFSQDGRQIATCDGGTAKVWEPSTHPERIVLSGHSHAVNAVAFSPDGRRVVTGSADQTARLWRAATGELLFTLIGHSDRVRSVAFSPKDQRIVTGSDDHTARVWDAATGRCLLTNSAHSGGVWALAFSSDGQRIVTASEDQTAKVWDATLTNCLCTFRGHTNRIKCAAFSPDSTRVVTGGDDQAARVWDPASGKELVPPLMRHRGPINSVAFSRDGQRIASAGEDGSVKVWDAASGKPLQPLSSDKGAINAVGFSPDARRIATGGGEAALWEAEGGGELLALNGHSNWITSLAFSQDGQRIVTGSLDGTAIVWLAAAREQVAHWRDVKRAASEDPDRLPPVEQEMPAPDPGAIRDWLVLAPILFEGPGDAPLLAALDNEQVAPEAQLHPRAGESVKAGQIERAWRAVHLKDYVLDFNELLGAETWQSVGYAVSYVQSENAQTNVSVWIGSDDEAKVYLNGKEIHSHGGIQPYVRDQDVVDGVELRAGPNVLVLKVVNGEGAWEGSVRLSDAEGNPLKGIRVSLDPP
jgi:WD40 repeat protein